MSLPQNFRLHHVGYAAREIGPVAAMYVARFGYAAVTGIIHDPLQTALVQFLQLAGQATYLEVVAPDGPESKLAGAVKRGGPLNHLCYATRELEAAILHLESTGMKLISDPKPAVAFAGRRICWLMGQDMLPIELVELQHQDEACVPGV